MNQDITKTVVVVAAMLLVTILIIYLWPVAVALLAFIGLGAVINMCRGSRPPAKPSKKKGGMPHG